jgi:RNA polymerase-binding transcription factor DksA
MHCLLENTDFLKNNTTAAFDPSLNMSDSKRFNNGKGSIANDNIAAKGKVSIDNRNIKFTGQQHDLLLNYSDSSETDNGNNHNSDVLTTKPVSVHQNEYNLKHQQSSMGVTCNKRIVTEGAQTSLVSTEAKQHSILENTESNSIRKASKKRKSLHDENMVMSDVYRSKLWEYFRNLPQFATSSNLPTYGFVPLDGGGLSGACVVPAQTCSIHIMCLSFDKCSFCLESMYKNSNRCLSDEAAAKDESKLVPFLSYSSEPNKYSSHWVFQDTTVNYSYNIHNECAVAAITNSLEKCYSNKNKYIKILHEYSGNKIHCCSFCCREGGILQKIMISPPEDADSKCHSEYLHPFCIGWIMGNAMFQNWSDMANLILYMNENKDTMESNSDVRNMELESFGHCAVCSSEIGITVRCCAPSCTVRVHPICAQTQNLTLLTIDNSDMSLENTNSDELKSTVCFLCSLHVLNNKSC